MIPYGAIHAPSSLNWWRGPIGRSPKRLMSVFGFEYGAVCESALVYTAVRMREVGR